MTLPVLSPWWSGTYLFPRMPGGWDEHFCRPPPPVTFLPFPPLLLFFGHCIAECVVGAQEMLLWDLGTNKYSFNHSLLVPRYCP